MVPWLVFQAVLTIFFLTTTLLNLNVIILLLGLFSAYCLLCVWSLLIKLIEDAGKKEADTGIELFSEPRQLILDTPLNIINLVPQQNNIQQPLDLPPSYNVIMERSSIPCVVPIDDSTLLYKTPVD